MGSDETTNGGPIRIATFNSFLNRFNEGDLIADVATPDDAQAQAVAEIIQRVDPDILLLNEFDYDAAGEAIALFQANYLGVSQNGAEPIHFDYVFNAESNTGILSGFDFNNDGVVGGPDDAFGFGFFPGQFGMIVLSKLPIVEADVRTFQEFLWADMPGALLPDDPATPEPADWYSPEELAVFRLSSKSHWDIPVMVDGEVVHILASHPTPPVFDGEEDRNGTRNHDEIRFWSDYVTPGENGYIYDDTGVFGGLAAGEAFVIMGDQNADPFDGDSTDQAILQLLDNPLINDTMPMSTGGVDDSARNGGVNPDHIGDPALDTASFNPAGPGNLRADYVLPSKDGIHVVDSGVFWPAEDGPFSELTGPGFPVVSSDHRLVYVDAVIEGPDSLPNRKTVGEIDVTPVAATVPPTPSAVPLKILLINDDGFDAEGIETMRERLLADGHTVTVVAPLEQQSGRGTAIDTDKIFQEVQVTEFRPGDFNVDGTPVTTTLAGLDFLLADALPELVVSGINEGQNVGDVATSSGTVSAVVTAILRDVPAIAISAGLNFAEAGAGFPSLAETYTQSADLVAALVNDLSQNKGAGLPLLPEGTGLNINVPSVWNGIDTAFTTVEGRDGLDFAFTQDTPGDNDVTYTFTFGAPTGSPESEGINFAAGNATLSVIDGDWSASEEVRQTLETRLDDLSFESRSEASEALDIMLVNDDGFDSRGIEVLAEALREAGHTVRIVAPADPQSGRGTDIDAAALGSVIEVTEFAPGDFSVASTPVNTTLVGLRTLLADTPPDLVVSGINEGQNVGLTTISSGTVSAAIAALVEGFPSIAVSAGIDFAEAGTGFPSTEIAYDIGAAFTVDLIADLIATQDGGPLLPDGVALSVNVPTGDIDGISFTRLDDVTPLGFSFGPISATENGLIVTFDEPNGDPLSEGSEFILGNITVTPLDGNYTAPQATREAVNQAIAEGTAFGAFLASNAPVDQGDFLGEVTLPTGFAFEGTEVGGLSGLAYDAAAGVYYALSDDRSQINDARFYTLAIDLADGGLDEGDMAVAGVTTLTDGNGDPFLAATLDPEGLALTTNGTLIITSEGDANALVDPFVNRFSLGGQQFGELPVPAKFLPTADQTSGIRNNLAFESATITPDGRYLYTATENALFQDGPAASLEDESPARIIKYDLQTEDVVAEYQYFTDAVADAPIPPGGFATNGLVELLAIDNSGTLLALERSFSVGVGNAVKLYEVKTQLATDLRGIDALIAAEGNPFGVEPGEAFELDAPVIKEEILDFGDLGITLDNLEALALGPTLPDGRQSLIVVSDNNFSPTQFTQVLAFAIDLETLPAAFAAVETPDDIRFGDPENPDLDDASDPDDPGIYVHPDDPSQSLVITTDKDTGLTVFDLAGKILQDIKLPEVRFNNVDIVYGFELGGENVDLAVVSDRLNDTLVVYEIDPATRQLVDITSPDMLESVFGLDDGEQTAYALATYTSLVDGKVYAFTSQRDGAQVAQVELFDDGAGGVGAEIVRTLRLPVPTGDVEDSQSEGIVVDRETGILYVALEEEAGILKFSAEPAGGDAFEIVQPIDADFFEPDIEGLTLYYGPNGTGYLIASSQGDATYAVFSREGTNEYLGSFSIEDLAGIDGAEETDGIDVVNVPLGDTFAQGLFVVQDGSNEPQVVFQDPEADGEGEVQNFNANFKFVPWENVADAFPVPLTIDPESFDPRIPQANSLANGIASGDISQESAVLWARSTFPGDITFEVATDPAFATIVQTVTGTVTDTDLPVKVAVEELTPGTDYSYRVTDAAGATLVGEFSTSHDANGFSGLTFGVSGDWRGELSPYPAIANAIDADLEFFVAEGDTIYADISSPAVLNEDGTEKAQAETLGEYRAKHAEVYGSRFGENFFAELRAKTPTLATIDDHEVTNDFAGGGNAGDDPRFTEDSGLINDTELFENGLQAFQEYNPIRDDFYGETGDPVTAGERELYRFNTHGADAATFVLDSRSFRDQQIDELDLSDPTDLPRYFTESFDPTRTLIGRAQVDDLKADLLEAEAAGVTWKFIMNPEPIQVLLPLPGADRWEGYQAERTELLKFIDENEISNVVFVSADVHSTFVNNLTYQEQPFGPQRATSAFEITTGSVAFDAPTGVGIVEGAAALGLLSPEQLAFYESLPIAPDLDDIPNDKDDFLDSLFKETIATLGLEELVDPLGLDDNIGIADGLIDAELIQGDYVSAHTFGWTQFDIDPITQELVVTTYGIEPYTRAELEAAPASILAREPAIVSQFSVTPETPARFGSDAAEELAGGVEDDALFGLGGNDTVAGGPGDDRISGGPGFDILKGDDAPLEQASGADTFVLAAGEGTDIIVDFEIGIDVIGLAGGLAVDDLTFSGDAIQAVGETLAILPGIDTAELSDSMVLV